MVAANWEKVPPQFKLAADLFWGGILAGAIYFADRKDRATAREVLLVIFWGYVLASISLIAQVYNLASEPYRGLLAWAVVTTPIMITARSKFAAFLFVVGWCITFGSMAELLWKTNFSLVVLPCLPFVALLVGKLLETVPTHANLGWALRSIGWVGIILGSSGMQIAWYSEVSKRMAEATLGVIAVSSITLVLVYLFYPSKVQRTRFGGFFITASLLAFAPFLAGGEADLLAAVSFLVLWIWVAYLANATSQVWFYNFAIGALAVRILVIYFEVFGSLLSTGIGLILGGGLTLLLGWLFSRWSIRSSGGGATSIRFGTKEKDA